MSDPRIVPPRDQGAGCPLTNEKSRHADSLAQILLSLSKRELTSDSELHSALGDIAKSGADALESSALAVWLFAKDRSKLVCVCRFDRQEGVSSRGPELALQEQVSSEYFSALTNHRVLAMQKSDPIAQMLLCMPVASSNDCLLISSAIWNNGEIIGVLVLEDDLHSSKWESEERTFFASLADLSSIAVLTAERQRIDQDHTDLEAHIGHAQKLESLGLLSGAVAHDFNNLLMSIIGSAGLVLTGLPTSSTTRKRVERIKSAAERAGDLTGQLLSFSGKDRFLIEAIDLSVLVNKMTLLLNTAISKKIRLKTELVPELPLFEADATQIRQIVMNLVANAAEAFEHGEGEITIGTGSCALDAEYLQQCYLQEGLVPGSYVYLEVADNGPGIDKEIQERIFDPFFSTKISGHGLGLAGVLGIVRSHQGTVHLDSDSGKGTTFRILFPVCFSEVKSDSAESPVRKQGPSEGLFLVVDDEVLILDLAEEILAEHGYQVITAQDGRKALELFREHKLSLVGVLLDMGMPEMDGKEALEEMQKVASDIPVILTSGYSEEDFTQDKTLPEFAGFIQKPYLPSDLIDMIEEVLR